MKIYEYEDITHHDRREVFVQLASDASQVIGSICIVGWMLRAVTTAVITF